MQNIIQTQQGQQYNQGKDDISIQVNSQLITIKRDNEEIADFLWSMNEEFMYLNIAIPEEVLNLDNEQMEELLSHIASHPKLVNTQKVKRFVRKQKQPMRTRLNTEIVKTCTSIKSKISINNPQLIPYIQSFGYTELVPIADGATKAVFKGKNQRKQFVAVKMCRLQQKHNEQQDIMKEVEQKMSRALFGGFLKVNRQIKDVDNRLMIIQQELANKTLRDIILEKRVKDQEFSQAELKKIIKDLVESLYYMHIKNRVAHRDIKPQNIFYMGHRYSFGDYGEAEKKTTNILSHQIKIKMTEIKGSPMYMEPRLLKLYNEICSNENNKREISLTHTFNTGNSSFEYDPFRADVYSLGVVLLELCLHNEGYRLDEQMENILFFERDKEFLKRIVASIDLRSKDEKYILFGQYMYQIPNLLEIMINEDQSLRIKTFDLALLSTPKETLLSDILTPFTDIFLPNKTVQDQQNKIYTVEYNYKGMVYRGRFENDKRDGYGVIYSRVHGLSRIKELPTDESEEDSGYKSVLDKSYDFFPIYEGEWKNDLPHGEGKLILNDCDNRYEGRFIRGMFSGEGGLYFGNNAIFKCPWRGNYHQYLLKPLSQFPYARVRFRMVCPISKTICGFQQASYQETEIQKKEFIIEIEEEHSSLIKGVLDQLILSHKKFPINKVEILRNLLHRYSQFILSNEQETLHFVFVKNVFLESWFLTRIVEEMNVESMKILLLNKSEMASEALFMMASKLRCFNIIELDLSNCCYISSNGLNKFFSTSIVNSLARVNLSNTLMDNDTMRLFAESKYLVRLRELVLRGCLGITDYPLKIFIQSPNVRELELFDIGHTSLSQGFTQGFLWQNQFKKLRRLRIDYITFQEADIQHLVKLPVLQGLTQFHADPIWIRYLNKLQNLRTLSLKGQNKIPAQQLMSFLKTWPYQKLDVYAVNITKSNKSYQYYQQQLPALKKSMLNSFTIDCYQKDLHYTFQILRTQLKTLQIDMNNNFSSFKEEFQNIKARKWNIGEIIFKYNKHVLEYITSILDLDFGAVRIQSIKIVGCYCEKKTKIFEQMEDNKIRFLEFNEMLKKITSVIKAKVVKIEEILYPDGVIAEMVKFQLDESVETLIINNQKHVVRNLYMMNNDEIQLCNTKETQTLDETLHALSVSECLAQLQGLNLFKRQNVGEKGLAHIINSKYCDNIKQLDLSHTDITSNIFNLLINSQHLHLNKLKLNGIKKFNIQDLQRYIACNNARNIKKLSLKDTNLNQLQVFFLQLTLESLQSIDIKFDPSLQYSNVSPSTMDLKYNNLKQISLDFYNCEMKKIIQQIFIILSSPVLRKLKLNLRCCKEKDLKYYQISELIFLKKLKAKKFSEFRIYFDSTSIFETSFIIYFQTISTFEVDLSFEKVMDNQFIEKLSFIFSNFNCKVVSLNFGESNLDNNSIEHLYTLIKGMRRVHQLTINFNKSIYIINWNKIIEAFTFLQEVRKINLNFADCKVGDEFEIMVHWLDQLSKKRKIQLTLDLAHCERIKSDKVFGKLAQLLSKDQRFNSKIRLDVTRFSNIPLDFKYKLIQLNHLSDQYQLLVDSSDK